MLFKPSVAKSYSGLHRSFGRVRQGSRPAPVWCGCGLDRPLRPSPCDGPSQPHIGAMHLDLSDEETAALNHELHEVIESDRNPLLTSHPHAEGDRLMNICGRLALRVFGFSFPPTVGDATPLNRKPGSLLTRRWREMDSNLRFPVREVVISAFPKWTGSR
jgi:hypothetical protein